MKDSTVAINWIYEAKRSKKIVKALTKKIIDLECELEKVKQSNKRGRG